MSEESNLVKCAYCGEMYDPAMQTSDVEMFEAVSYFMDTESICESCLVEYFEAVKKSMETMHKEKK